MTDLDTTNFEVEIPDELYADLVEEAAEAGISVEEHVKQLILDYCKELPPEQVGGA
jgi:predicted HicB family RNase H-like nuclease